VGGLAPLAVEEVREGGYGWPDGGW
jgi:hypothetical protein